MLVLVVHMPELWVWEHGVQTALGETQKGQAMQRERPARVLVVPTVHSDGIKKEKRVQGVPPEAAVHLCSTSERCSKTPHLVLVSRLRSGEAMSSTQTRRETRSKNFLCNWFMSLTPSVRCLTHKIVPF